MFLLVQETHRRAMIVLLPNRDRKLCCTGGDMYFLGAARGYGKKLHTNRRIGSAMLANLSIVNVKGDLH